MIPVLLGMAHSLQYRNVMVEDNAKFPISVRESLAEIKEPRGRE